MQHALDAFLAVAGRHPFVALGFIAFVAFAESVAIVGTFVPAAFILFGAGVLVGHGTLPMAWTVGLAAAGAVAGDALSYELGRRQQDRVRGWPLLVRHEFLVRKAQALVARHGAASVVIARFTGAVRAFVPLLAGLGGMAPGRFYATNAASAALWAPAHILPGVVFGVSLRLAEQASGRLAVLVLLVAAVVWAAVWTARVAIRVLVPSARRLRGYVWRMVGARTAWWARLVRLLVDPDRPDSPALLVAFVLLLACMWLFLGIMEDVVSRDPLVLADQAVFAFLQQLRTHPVDRWMVGITEMGSVGVMLPLIAVVAVALAVNRCWHTAGYWLATAATSEVVVQVLKNTLGRHRPLSLYQGVEQFSFPSGHATMSAVVLAFLAFLLGRGQSTQWKFVTGALAAVYVALVGFSRLYLGAHWMSDVLGGFSFGLATVALSAMVYTQHRVSDRIAVGRVATIAGATIVVSAFIWCRLQGPADMLRYAPTPTPRATTLAAWSAGGFSLLPAYRREFAGEHDEPLPVQVACPASGIVGAMRRVGWVPAAGLSAVSLLQAIAPSPAIGQLPVLPKYDAGRASSLNLVATGPGTTERSVLRLWRSEWQIGAVPVWYGTFYRERQLRPDFGALRQQPAAASVFEPVLAGAGLRRLDGPQPGGGTSAQLWVCQ